jgi:hypothetical protein
MIQAPVLILAIIDILNQHEHITFGSSDVGHEYHGEIGFAGVGGC